MSWHYRIVRHTDGSLGLHEVYCDEAGQPNGFTAEPVSFVSYAEEGAAGIIAGLEMALRDARVRPIFDPEESTGPETPGADGKVLLTLWLPADLMARIEALGPDYEAHVERILQQAMVEDRL